MEKRMEKKALRDAFVKRDKRYLLLDKGTALAEFDHDSALLEIGCAGGEAAEHLAELGYGRLTAVDIDAQSVEQAAKRTSLCRFVCADACRLPFAEESFDGIISEAAFSVITDKAAAAGEYARVLRPGGRFLLNDFTLRTERAELNSGDIGIPALEGVQTMAVYRQLMESHGLHCVYEREEFPEFIRIAISLSRIFEVSPAQVGKFIVASFGSSEYVTDFFSNTKMSYCQMIFEKG